MLRALQLLKQDAPAATVSELGLELCRLVREAQDYVGLVHVYGSRIDDDALPQRIMQWQKLLGNLQTVAGGLVDPGLRPLVLTLHGAFSRVDPAIAIFGVVRNTVVDAVKAAMNASSEQVPGVREELQGAMDVCTFAAGFPNVAADGQALTTCHVAATVAMLPAIQEQLRAARMDGMLRFDTRAACKELATRAAQYGVPRAEQAARCLLRYVKPCTSDPAICALKQHLTRAQRQRNLAASAARITAETWRLLIEAAPQLLVAACQKPLVHILTYHNAAFERGLLKHFQWFASDCRACLRSLLHAYCAVCCAARFMYGRLGAQSAAGELITQALQPLAKPVLALFTRAFPTLSCPCEPFLHNSVSGALDAPGTSAPSAGELAVVNSKLGGLSIDNKAAPGGVRKELTGFRPAHRGRKRAPVRKGGQAGRGPVQPHAGGASWGGGDGVEDRPMRRMALSPGQPGSAAPAGSPFPGAGHWATTTFMPR